jgi:hypothetical protein
MIYRFTVYKIFTLKTKIRIFEKKQYQKAIKTNGFVMLMPISQYAGQATYL